MQSLKDYSPQTEPPLADESYEDECTRVKADIIETLKSGNNYYFQHDKSIKDLFDNGCISAKDAMTVIVESSSLLFSFELSIKPSTSDTFRAKLQNVLLNEAFEILAEKYCTEEVQAMTETI